MKRPRVVVFGAFDDVRSRDIRFLEEASHLGALTVLLWSDHLCQEQWHRPPKFPASERHYFLRAVRYVDEVVQIERHLDFSTLPAVPGAAPDIWAVLPGEAHGGKAAASDARGVQLVEITERELAGFPAQEPRAGNSPAAPPRQKVIVTGCYDWFHSGHVRFFEEVSAYGDLYVVVGHDANIRLLKGEGHPLLPQEERRYLAGSIRFVTEALISTGNGWLDAEPEIDRLRPDIYAVNEDGDRGGKRDFCEKRGIKYLVLKRTPAPGLPTRSSTNLRGF